MTHDPKLALWSLNMGWQAPSATAWLAAFEQHCAEATAEQADLLCLPEYACDSWMHFIPDDLPPAEQADWMAEQAETLLPQMRERAHAHDLSLLAGSLPVSAAVAGKRHNRAFFYDRSGETHIHDKLCLTPVEKSLGWDLIPGQKITVFDWQGWRVALLICLDIELPALSPLLAAERVDLILNPSMTRYLSGWSRVNSCARARAIECYCPVAVTGCHGGLSDLDRYTGAAAIYTPAERALCETGIWAEMEVLRKSTGSGVLLISDPLPLNEIRHRRETGKAEVWPGAWQAPHQKTPIKAS